MKVLALLLAGSLAAVVIHDIRTPPVLDVPHPAVRVVSASATNTRAVRGRPGCNALEHWDCRSLEVKHAFWRATGHPHGWHGHVVDHIEPRACGGADTVSNMQWQTVAEGHLKDSWERRGCANGHRYAGKRIVRGQLAPL